MWEYFFAGAVIYLAGVVNNIFIFWLARKICPRRYKVLITQVDKDNLVIILLSSWVFFAVIFIETGPELLKLWPILKDQIREAFKNE